MRRALRWLWHLCTKVALAGVILAGVMLLHAAPAAKAFAQEPTRQVQQQAAASEQPTPQEEARAKQRAHQGRLLFLGSLLYEGALLAGFLALGGTRWLAGLTARFGRRWILGLAAVFLVLSLGGGLLTFPLDYYSGFIFEHQYGLSNQSTWQWLGEYLIGQVVGLVIGFPLVLLGYGLFRKSPKRWWLWVTAASVPVSIFLMLISPVFIAPLFNKFTPLKDAGLRQEILTLAHQQGIPAHDVFQVDASKQSKAVNAYVNGFGPTLRIVLYDTLMKEFTHEEILSVMAHEMGHYVLGHIYQGIAFSILTTFFGMLLLYRMSNWTFARFGGWLGVTELGNPASMPVMMALGMVLSLLAMPIGNAFSRHIEWQADKYGLKVYPHYDASISAFHKLAKYNVAEEDPPRWAVVLLGSHPSIAERIAYIEQVKAEHTGK